MIIMLRIRMHVNDAPSAPINAGGRLNIRALSVADSCNCWINCASSCVMPVGLKLAPRSSTAILPAILDPHHTYCATDHESSSPAQASIPHQRSMRPLVHHPRDTSHHTILLRSVRYQTVFIIDTGLVPINPPSIVRPLGNA